MAIVVSAFVGYEGLNRTTFWFPFLGGLIWAVSGWCAFIGTSRIGMAKAFGIWAPMNIIVSIIWGIILFGEFKGTGSKNIMLALAAVAVIIAGILTIIFAGGDEEKSTENKKAQLIGLLGTMGAGVGFATYFIPIQIGTADYPDFNMWIGTLPLAVGMVTGASILVLVTKSSLKLEKGSHYFRLLSTGVLWGLGNYGALVMMKPENLGTGQGFTIAQLCVVINAIIGIYWLKSPKPKTRAANLTLLGVFIAAVGGVIFGIFVQH
jgi:glucose uptake protein